MIFHATTTGQYTDKKILHIDVAKGFGILLVALGHNVIISGELARIIYSFHVPLFFFLSGLFFNPDIRIVELIVNKSKSLLKPYIVFMAIGGIFVVYQNCSIAKYFYYVFYGAPFSPLWFISHLWLLFIFVWGVSRLTKIADRKIPGKSVIIVGLFVAGLQCLDYFRDYASWVSNLPLVVFGVPVWPSANRIVDPIGCPFNIDLVMLTGCYFLSGFFLRGNVLEWKINKFGFLLSIVAFAALHYFFDYSINIHLGIYDNLLISTIQTILGIYIVINLSCMVSRLQSIAKIVAYIGTGSLFILLFHNYIQGGTYLLLSMLAGAQHYVNGVISFAAGCLAPLLIWEVIKRSKWLSYFWLP